MPLSDKYYPEITSCMLCINAPSVFANVIWPFFRRLISEEQQRRVIIASRERTKALLARLAPADEVPACVFHAAGTCAQMPRSVAELAATCSSCHRRPLSSRRTWLRAHR